MALGRSRQEKSFAELRGESPGRQMAGPRWVFPFLSDVPHGQANQFGRRVFLPAGVQAATSAFSLVISSPQPLDFPIRRERRLFRRYAHES